MRVTKSLAGLLALSFVLSACAGPGEQTSGDSQSGQQSEAQSASQSGAQSGEDAFSGGPTVDRDTDVKLPEITFDDEGKPSMKPLKESAPKNITVKTLTKGDGAEVLPDDIVTVNYAGFLWDDGKEFDSSYGSDKPVSFSLNNLIQGWKWGLAGTHVGDTVEIAIPSEFGYGSQGSGDRIPPDSPLVFVVEVQGALTIDPAVLKEATPTEQALPSGLEIGGELGEQPTIEFAASSKPPKKRETLVLAEGTGTVVTDSDMVVVHSSGAPWGESAGTESTWGQDPEHLDASQLPELLGRRVGSRVVILIPSKKDEAPAAAFVIDILGSYPK
ncbi:FKBP-type peptidyl-prolyl cis-trans isomerase [Scrofimicrobium canadense]|nr:FKBP-type peptidyl-prolyl cis-trans isomerase [Scrofimicrobium canadense]